jgi:hypothetical protein
MVMEPETASGEVLLLAWPPVSLREREIIDEGGKGEEGMHTCGQNGGGASVTFCL